MSDPSGKLAASVARDGRSVGVAPLACRQFFLQVAMTRIQASTSRTNSKFVVPDVVMLRAGRCGRGEWWKNGQPVGHLHFVRSALR